jgi:GDP-L-fucose synthase
MKKKILVTGGTGLVGSAIRKLYEHDTNNYEFLFVSSSVCNLLSYSQTLECFSSFQPDYIIHLAANVGGLFKNLSQPVQMLEDNIQINSNVLKVAHEIKVKKLIACLSTCIFPDKIQYPITESDINKGPPHESNASYAYAKRLLQTQCEAYQQQYGDPFVCFIPTNIYGWNDNFHLHDAHVIPALIHKCFLAKQNQQPFIISGTGQPLRQFLYSDDLAQILVSFCCCNDSIIKTMILSPDETDEVSIEYIGRLIAKEMNYEHCIEFDTTQSDGQYQKTASNAIFRQLYPEYIFTKVEDGLKTTIQWFLENYPNIRM